MQGIVKKKRVFHIISHFELGGAERVAANIAKSGNPAIEYHIVEALRGSSPFTADFLAELRAAGVVCHRSWMPGVHFHFIAERLAAIVFPLRFLLLWMRYRPQVVHAHTEVPDMCVWAFFHVFPWLQRRCRIVRTIHNTRLWSGLKKFGLRAERFYQRNGANVAISQSVLHCYEKEYGERPPIIYNGVPEAEQMEMAGLPKDKTNILFAGRLSRQKGIPHLIYIIKALSDMPEYHFHIVGNGPLLPMVEQEVGGLPSVSICAPVFGISRYLASFDYLLMPSEFEGLPLMSVEASMAGLPVICSDGPGLNETVPVDWPLVARGNSHAEYDNIFRKVLPQTDRGELRRKAKAYVAQRFSLRRMQQEYEEVYGALSTFN